MKGNARNSLFDTIFREIRVTVRQFWCHLFFMFFRENKCLYYCKLKKHFSNQFNFPWNHFYLSRNVYAINTCGNYTKMSLFDKNFVKVTFYLIWRNFFLWDTHYSEKGDFTECLKDSSFTQLHWKSVKFTSCSFSKYLWFESIIFGHD